MRIPNGLKRICDISFYMTFASFIGGGFGSDSLILTLPIFVFVAFLSAFLAPRGWVRYTSLLPLFLIFVIIPLTIVNLVVVIPAIIFMICSLPPADEYVTSFEYSGVFKLFLVIFGGFLAIFAIIEAQIPGDTLLFGTSFLFNSIIFMRMIRHDESVLKQTQFKIMNTVSIVGVVISAILISTEAFLTFVQNAIRFIWWHLIGPIFLLVISIFTAILAFILRLLGLEGIFEPGLYEVPELEMEMILEEEELTLAHALYIFFIIIFATFFIIIVTILLVVLVRKLFKWLTQQSRPPYLGEDGIEEERFALDDDEKKKRRFRRRTENQIREVYRKFLIFLKKKEVNIPQHFTSSDVNELVATKFKSEKSSELRDEYIQVRYGESDYTKEDIKRIKRLHKEIKEEIERF